MAALTVSILSLNPSSTPVSFIDALKSSDVSPLIVARVVQWIITPTYSSHLLAHNWDFIVVVPTNTTLPSAVTTQIATTITFRIQETLLPDFLNAFASKNHQLLTESTTPPLYNLDRPLIATSNQSVELTPALLAFVQSPLCPVGAISMLNFVSFHPFASARASYQRYKKEFLGGVGTKVGGDIKMFGKTEELGEWDEVIIAHYPSAAHFADMAADATYQEINTKYRLPAIRDTCILMCTEVDLSWGVANSSKHRAVEESEAR